MRGVPCVFWGAGDLLFVAIFFVALFMEAELWYNLGSTRKACAKDMIELVQLRSQDICEW